jgi:hypothetical protein
MTRRLSSRLFYGLVLSIVALMIGFVGLLVRAFESAINSDFIFLGAFGVLLAAVTIYFVLHRPLAGRARDRKTWPRSSAWTLQIPRRNSAGRDDRRMPLVPGQKWAAVARERRSKQIAGFRVPRLRPIASETSRG